MKGAKRMAKEVRWARDFGPSYTPEQMLRMGVFEGKYVNDIPEVPASWKNTPKVLKPSDEPDPELNKYGVKSRQGLSVWKKNNWIRDHKYGWFHWYILYYLGKYRGPDDEWQISRWRSFIARHQAQIKNDPKGSNKDRRLVQKQALLQWAWDWTESPTEEKINKNAKAIARQAGIKLQEEEEEDDKKKDKKSVSKESLIIVLPAFKNW